ncbi:MAG: hypothetical protein JWM77_3730 [Rhodospirillales bacterium]|jgi:3-deoxy-D-manno-octulosonic acid (KDO) 8-phosphate synthase|nr:hypothetical protein [Rhodospirillales bacterium]
MLINRRGLLKASLATGLTGAFVATAMAPAHANAPTPSSLPADPAETPVESYETAFFDNVFREPAAAIAEDVPFARAGFY